MHTFHPLIDECGRFIDTLVCGGISGCARSEAARTIAVESSAGRLPPNGVRGASDLEQVRTESAHTKTVSGFG